MGWLYMQSLGGHSGPRQYLDAQFAYERTERRVRAELAALVEITPRHLTTIFRRQLGTSPHAWLLARRIERARSLLTASALDMTGIALACGFSSAQHFASTFKRVEGVTPGEFRRLYTL